jgi:anti-anti-sigma factor
VKRACRLHDTSPTQPREARQQRPAPPANKAPSAHRGLSESARRTPRPAVSAASISTQIPGATEPPRRATDPNRRAHRDSRGHARNASRAHRPDGRHTKTCPPVSPLSEVGREAPAADAIRSFPLPGARVGFQLGAGVPLLGAARCAAQGRKTKRAEDPVSLLSAELPSPHFQIDASHEPRRPRLTLNGELDLATAPRLESCLRQLKDERQSVCLDLSRLEFIDSSGIHLLLSAVEDARRDGWDLWIADEVSLW